MAGPFTGGAVELDQANERIGAGQAAGDQYISDLESIRNELDADDNSGTTLGKMVGATISMIEAETKYMVRSGIPKKASSAVQQAASDVKKASG